ncbi:hypothetical protein [Archangium sp.]|uniref:hypothetical protein n=1 Tax=Archangium sp. TaxID=1872627 RepID=UPI00389AD25C
MLPALGLAVGVLCGALEPSGGAALLAREGFVVGDAPRRLLLVPAAEGGSMEAHGSLLADERLESSQDARRLHRTLSLVTTGSLLVTGVLGTLTAINEGTAFKSGRCETGGPLFGDYGCDSLHIVHGASAILSTTLYTATAVQGLSIGSPSLAQEHGPLYRILSYVHLVGIVVQPLLGLISAYPEVIGIDPEAREHFGDVMRTVHIGVGYVTIAAYATTTVLEF